MFPDKNMNVKGMGAVCMRVSAFVCMYQLYYMYINKQDKQHTSFHHFVIVELFPLPLKVPLFYLSTYKIIFAKSVDVT